MDFLPTTSGSQLTPALAARTWHSRMLDWMVEARSHRVICLVASIWILNAFDLAFTIMSNDHGFLQEQNPVARHMLEQGTLPVVLFKIGLVLIGTYPLLRFRATRIAELGAYVVLLVYALLAVRWSACFELYALSTTHNLNYAEIERIQTLVRGSPN